MIMKFYFNLKSISKNQISAFFYLLHFCFSSAQNSAVMGIPENVVKAMPTERVHERSRLLQPGEQCRLCLRSYQKGERVRRLPCRHKFHIDCIGN
jgi:E3 ubiquitin-protein ligase ZSWIM2